MKSIPLHVHTWGCAPAHLARRPTRHRWRLAALALLAGMGAPALAQATPPAAETGTVDGKGVYQRVCIACHQAKGEGAAGVAPALAGPLAPMLRQAESRAYLSGVLTQGISGPLVTQGQTFVGAMPKWAQLSDAELAAAATYVGRELNQVAGYTVSADDVAAARKAALNHKALRDLRARLLK